MNMSLDPERDVFMAFDFALLPAMLRSLWYGRTRSVEWMAEHAIGPVFRRRVQRYGPASVVRGCALGRHGERLAVDYVETSRDGYWISGVVPATAARLLCEGKIAGCGITTLDRAMDPIALADELGRVGIEFRVGAPVR